MNPVVKKAIKVILLGFILLLLSFFITKSTAGFELRGLQITAYNHCGETYGFPFLYRGGGVILGPDGLHGDCMISTNLFSYFLNVVFWLMVLIAALMPIKSVFGRAGFPHWQLGSRRG